MMHMAKAVATQVARKTVATTSTIGGRAAPACQAASGLRRADMAHKGSRWLSTSGATAGSPAGGEERLSGSGGEDLLRGLSEEEVLRVGTRTQEMWKDHVALTTSFPEASLPPGAGGQAAVSPDAVRRKRLVYRSKQRGWLEVDLLMGTWAEKNVPHLTIEEMDSYEDILNLETVDIFSFIAGNAEPPAFVDTPMMKRLQAYVKSNPLGQSPVSYASAKRENNLT
ncbi:unnamed protein product [Laminaria digitata]